MLWVLLGKSVKKEPKHLFTVVKVDEKRKLKKGLKMAKNFDAHPSLNDQKNKWNWKSPLK